MTKILGVIGNIIKIYWINCYRIKYRMYLLVFIVLRLDVQKINFNRLWMWFCKLPRTEKIIIGEDLNGHVNKKRQLEVKLNKQYLKTIGPEGLPIEV